MTSYNCLGVYSEGEWVSFKWAHFRLEEGISIQGDLYIIKQVIEFCVVIT